MLNRQ